MLRAVTTAVVHNVDLTSKLCNNNQEKGDIMDISWDKLDIISVVLTLLKSAESLVILTGPALRSCLTTRGTDRAVRLFATCSSQC